MKIKVKDKINLNRDTKSSAIINNNIQDRDKKRLKKKFLLKLRKDIDDVMNRLDQLEDKRKK